MVGGGHRYQFHIICYRRLSGLKEKYFDYGNPTQGIKYTPPKEEGPCHRWPCRLDAANPSLAAAAAAVV